MRKVIYIMLACVLLQSDLAYATVVQASTSQSDVADQAFHIQLDSKGSKLHTTSENLFAGFGQVLPGDHLERAINIDNLSTQEATFYLQLETKDGLSQAEENLLRTIQLKITTGENEGKILYQGPLLPNQKTDSISLGNIDPQDRSQMSFAIDLPAEMTNWSAGLASSVQWNFRAEYEEQSGQKKVVQASPQTGDRQMILLYGVLMVVAIFVAVLAKIRQTMPCTRE